MTATPAWPDVDEDIFRKCESAFDRISRAVDTQLEFVSQERSQIFSGIGLWAGGAADAASESLDRRITDLGTVKEQLNTAARLFTESIFATVSAKNEIISNVEVANQILDWIRTHPDIPQDAKNAAIAEGIAAIRAENIAVVASAASQISSRFSLSTEASSPNTIESLRGGEPKQSPNSVPMVDSRGPSGSSDVVAGLVPSALLPEAPAFESSPHSPEGSLDTVSGPSRITPVEMPTQVRTSHEAQGTPDIAESPPSSAPNLTGSQLDPSPVGPSMPGLPGTPGTPSAPPAPSVGAPSSPLSTTSAPLAPSASATNVPSTANPSAAAASQAQLGNLQQSAAEAATRAVAQQSFSAPPPAAPMSAAPAAQSMTAPLATDTPTAPPPSNTPSAAGPSASGGQAPVAPIPGTGAAPASPVQLGPPATPPPSAAPVNSAANIGPAVPPAAAAAGAGTVGAPAPVPVSAARAQREAIAAATLRRVSGSDPVVLAQRIAAALNVGNTDIGFFWITGLAKDGSIVVANNYGLGYIPESVHLPEQVTMVTADETISATQRGSWATYPLLALHGWAQHHNTDLRVVIATEEQFKGFDPGVPRIVLRSDDIPDSGRMTGRHRLQVIAPDAAAKLASIPPADLSAQLPPSPADSSSPDDRRALLWFEVFRPLLSTDPGRGSAQLQSFAIYCDHAQELSLHRAHTATDAADQRAAIADWLYWQHLSVLVSEGIASGVTA